MLIKLQIYNSSMLHSEDRAIIAIILITSPPSLDPSIKCIFVINLIFFYDYFPYLSYFIHIFRTEYFKFSYQFCITSCAFNYPLTPLSVCLSVGWLVCRSNGWLVGRCVIIFWIGVWSYYFVITVCHSENESLLKYVLMRLFLPILRR